jgi:hypothetical protein
MNRTICLLAVVLATTYSASVVGSEIVYKSAPLETNELAMQTVERLFRSTDTVQLEDLAGRIVCGPGLWRMIEEMPTISELDPVGATSVVDDGGGGFQEFEGALFQTEEQRTELIDIVRHILKDSEFQIRTPNEHELRVYWSLIPYDIEEPIYILDNGARRILVDFVVTDESVQLFWIGDMSQFGFQGDGGQ